MNNGNNTQGNVETKPNNVATLQQNAPAMSDSSAAIIQSLVEQNRELINELKALREMKAAPQTVQKASSGRQRSVGTPMICTETGLIYKSKAQGAKAVAHEFGYTKDNPPVNKSGEPAWNFVIYYIIQKPGGKYRLVEYTGGKDAGDTDEEFVLEWLDKNQDKYLESLEGSGREPSPLFELLDDDSEETEKVEQKGTPKTTPEAKKSEVTTPQQPQKPVQQAPANQQKHNNQSNNKR